MFLTERVIFVLDTFLLEIFFCSMGMYRTQGGHVGNELGYQCKVGEKLKIMEKAVRKMQNNTPKYQNSCHTLPQRSVGISE